MTLTSLDSRIGPGIRNTHLAMTSTRAIAAHTEYEVVWARHEDEVRAAQRLRFEVFSLEMGATLQAIPGTPPGHDADRFDAHCEHLIVRIAHGSHGSGQVIGTYRVLAPAAARRAGGLYSETEFDLSAVAPWASRLAELGRSCVHPDHRSGSTVMLLWRALGEFMVRNRLDAAIGCASVSLRDGGHAAASLWERLRLTHLAEPRWRVHARNPLPVQDLDRGLRVAPPALIKGYLACGAKVLGPPSWDPAFNAADLPMMMRLSDLPSRYRRHFLGDALRGALQPA